MRYININIDQKGTISALTIFFPSVVVLGSTDLIERYEGRDVDDDDDDDEESVLQRSQLATTDAEVGIGIVPQKKVKKVKKEKLDAETKQVCSIISKDGN